jgi:hypothetical protein
MAYKAVRFFINSPVEFEWQDALLSAALLLGRATKRINKSIDSPNFFKYQASLPTASAIAFAIGIRCGQRASARL